MKALVAKGMLGHLDIDVKVIMVSCINEIMTITATDAPYDDDLMEIFQKIVEVFEKLDEISSRSYYKRTLILKTIARIQSYLIMLDLECDILILEMVHHFLRTIRPYHLENIFHSIETIMILIIEESDNIFTELLTCLLDAVKKDNEDILPSACRLGEKVMNNCIMKLKPYMKGLVNLTSASSSQDSKIASLICQENSYDIKQKDTSVHDKVIVKDP